jgi:hypothetical protein
MLTWQLLGMSTSVVVLRVVSLGMAPGFCTVTAAAVSIVATSPSQAVVRF